MLAHSSEDDFDEQDDDVLQLADDAIASALPASADRTLSSQRTVRKRSSKGMHSNVQCCSHSDRR